MVTSGLESSGKPGSDPAEGMSGLPADYPQFLTEIKARIAAARTRAVLAVNSELINLYWEIGHEILERQGREGWGAKIIDRLAADLRREFPDMTGLSLRNLRYMRAFAQAWPAEDPSAIVQQPAAQLPWFETRSRTPTTSSSWVCRRGRRSAISSRPYSTMSNRS